MPRLNTKVESTEQMGENTRVDVRVDSLSVIPQEFQELRARARALTATTYSESVSAALSDVELGDLDRLTRTLEVKEVMSQGARESKLFTVEVDLPLD